MAHKVGIQPCHFCLNCDAARSVDCVCGGSGAMLCTDWFCSRTLPVAAAEWEMEDGSLLCTHCKVKHEQGEAA